MEQNKTGKYLKYAIGEIVLVVIGILIALSINNWNQQIKIKLEEQKLLQGLQIEMLKNRLHLNNLLELHQSGKDHHKSLLQIFQEESLTYDSTYYDSLWVNAIGSRLFTTYNPSYGNVKTIITSGKLGYLTNLKLASLISSFENNVNDLKEGEPIIENLYRNHVGPLSSDYTPGIMFGKLIFQSDFYGFSKDKKLFDHFKALYNWRQSQLAEEKNLLTEIDEMLDLIEKEIKND